MISMKNRTSVSLLAMALLMFMLLFITQAGDAMAAPVSRQSQTISPALAASIPAALSGLKKKKVFLVDVRRPAEYAKYHIPGSLNIPLFALKAKPFLKSKPVILVNDGFAASRLAAACKRLNRAGFKAAVLPGGLLAWKEKGGRLIGDPFAMQQMNRVPPAIFMQESRSGDYLLIDASKEKNPPVAGAMRQAVHLPLLEKQGPAKLKKLIRKNSADPFRAILICTRDGRSDDLIQRRLAEAGIRRVFFLQGGRQAYEKQLKYLSLSRKPKQKRSFSTGGCKTCARRAETAQ
jgi:rhodanese-related sulfurtransferase